MRTGIIRFIRVDRLCRWLTAAAVLLCGMLFAFGAAAEEKPYLVGLRPQVALFSEEEEETPPYCTATEEELRQYLAEGIVEYYEPNSTVTLFDETPPTPTWQLQALAMKEAWKFGLHGNGIRVAVIDSGVTPIPLIEGTVLPGHNFLDPDSEPIDTYGHGTFVAGMITGGVYSNRIVGVAREARIVPLKCFEKNTGSMSSVVSAIYAAVKDYHCRVINMSFGDTEYSQTLENAVNYAIQHGCIVVAAVGNNAEKAPKAEYYPAKQDGVIGVGSVDSSLTVSYFSQRNTTVDVVAPGERLQGLSISGFTGTSGTSFSTPQVAALAALALNVRPELDSFAFERLITETATDLGEEGYDTSYGYGFVNVPALMTALFEDLPYYLSPVTVNNGAADAVFYNHTEQPLEACLLEANYTDRAVMTGARHKKIEAQPNELVPLHTEQGSGLRFFVWKDLLSMQPLSGCY